MAPNRKTSRGTIGRPGRGRKAIGKSASAKARDESRAAAAVKVRSEKTKKDSKPGGPVAKADVKPVKSKVGLLAETSIKSGTLKAAAAKPADASAFAAPVKAGGKIDPREAAADKSSKPEPRAGSKAPAAAAPASPPQPETKAKKVEVAAQKVVATTVLSEQQPATPAAAVGAVMPPAKAPMETRLRYIKRYVDLAGPDMVPLSRKVSQVVWAFDVVDAFTGTSAVGKTHIFAVLKDQEAEHEHIELATYSNRLGRLVVQTRTTLKKDEPFDPLTSLVSVAGRTLDQTQVVKLRFDNELYDPKIIAQDEFLKRVLLNPAPSYPFPSAHDPDGSTAFILGLAPDSFKADGVAKMIKPSLPDEGGKSLIDDQHRFALWGPASQMLAGDKPSFEVQFEISDAPVGKRKLKLTYRATRKASDDNSGTMDGAKNTDRMKLTGLDSSQPDNEQPIQAAAVPPAYLLLQ